MARDTLVVRALRYLRERGPDNPAPSFELADAIGIDRYTVGPNLKRARDRGLIERIRTPGVKQSSWIASAKGLGVDEQRAPASPPPGLAETRPDWFTMPDWREGFVPALPQSEK